MEEQKNQRIFRMQPILCPWITSQPYHSSLWSKNRAPSQNDPSLTNRFLNNPWINRQMPMGIPRSQDKPVPSIQQSSSQFFYFLRLMQLFPDTHPATLHTVLTLCKNDFFCAVDKMLYAKRCKLLCYKKNLILKNQQSKNKSANEPVAVNKICIRNNLSSTQVSNNSAETDNVGNLSEEKIKVSNDAMLNITLQEVSSPLVINSSFTEKAEDLSGMKLVNNSGNSSKLEEIKCNN